MQEVYLVRHGTAQNPQGIFDACEHGFPLSDRGTKEARKTARFLEGRGIEVVYHSPLERCAQTAAIIASALRVPTIESPQIDEWDGKESLRDVQARMNAFYMTLCAQTFEKLAVVSHRDPLRVLMLSLAGRKLAEIYKLEVFPLAPGGVYLLKPGPEKTTFENIFTPSGDV